MKSSVIILLLSLMLSSCNDDSSNQAQGYVEGLLTYITSSTSGYLTILQVERGDKVEKDSPLFSLSLQPENHAYSASKHDFEQALGNKEDITAQLQLASLKLARYKVLYKKSFLQKESLDEVQASYNSLVAQLQEAEATAHTKEAQLAQNAWTISQKKITAPKQGIVFDVYYRLGEFIQPNKAVLSILAKEDIKIIFYVYQPKLSLLHLGDTIKTTCDNDKWVDAKVSFISPQAEYTPPLIFSNNTNSKLVFRIEARYDKVALAACHPGQPVTVKYAGHR